MSCKYELGEKLSNGLYELYRNGNKTNAQIKSLDLIKSDKVFIIDGTFHGGVFHDGEFYGGTFHGGYFYGGTFRGGDFLGGIFCSGNFHEGEFNGGTFHRGDFYGGTFNSGYFLGGIFCGGVYNSTPLQISGSKHYLNYTEYGGEPSISIGCHTRIINDWLKHYDEIGAEEYYSDEEIEEYKEYIDMFAKRYLK